MVFMPPPQAASGCGFDFVAAQLRQSPDGGTSIDSLQPLTYANALLAPPGSSGQASSHLTQANLT